MTKKLRKKDVNVIVVGWNSYISFSVKGYLQSVANTRLAGSMVAELIKFINKQMGNTPASFHLIGFSLGAHVAGYVGKRLKNVARITGLDPAGPRFQGFHTDVKLDSSDAAFVDVIHTDSGHTFNHLSMGPEERGEGNGLEQRCFMLFYRIL
ncbi:Pancreatic lipase-related protein 2 [Exaiptasia diaphana]|nr:Pancreatic lipase-related protein 2 [Exaiptasia diaphana]